MQIKSRRIIREGEDTITSLWRKANKGPRGFCHRFTLGYVGPTGIIGTQQSRHKPEEKKAGNKTKHVTQQAT